MNVSGAMASLELNEVTIKVPTTINYAIDFRGKTLAVNGSTIEGSIYGLYLNNGMSETKVRGTTFKGYTRSGLYIDAGKLDMGTATERGNNVFMGPETGAYGLDDSRQSATIPITVSNTTFNGFRPPAGMVTAPPPYGNLMEPGKYHIAAPGNIISFFEL
jgi:hypothetical protein